MSTPLMQVDRVRKRFDGVKALDDFSCSINEGEVVGLIGPNGAGKTTLFNVITGLVRPDGGRVLFRSRDLLGLPAFMIANRGIARTFQELRLVRELSVIDNVLLAFRGQPGDRLWRVVFRWRTCNMAEARNRAAARSLLESVGILRAAQDAAGALSYGQQKLLSIVCCLASDARLLLLDEPFAGIAERMHEKTISIIRDVCRSGKSVFLIEHNLEAVTQVCDRVVFMDEGRKISEGRPEDVRNDPSVIAAYTE
jgi:ABC-type branched-subunit amino acid transport system ATPase component